MRKASVLLLAVILSGLAWAADVNSDFGLEEASAPPQTTIVGSPKALTWVDRTAINQGTSRPAAAAVNGKVYYFGGQSATTPVHLGVTGEYDPIANTWTARDTMPARASNITCAVWNNKVYVPGGYTDGPVYLNNLQVFDPSTGTWTQQTAMPVALSGAACAVVGDTLYVMGGYNGSAYVNTVYAYDLVAQTWSTKAPMAYARAYFGAAAVGGKIYAIGGRDGTITDMNYNEEYDPATNTWTTKTAIPTARGGLGVTAFGGKVYAVGGGWSSYLTTIDVYDPAANTWSTETPMLHGTRTVGVAAMGNDLYVVGGWAGAFLNYNQLGGQAPQAVWSLPVDGLSGAHVNPEVKIAFSEPMAQASFGYACNPSLGAVNGLLWNAAGDTLTISLVNNKAYSTTYALDYWATDLSGLNLAAGPVSNPITFTTWDAPEVIYSQMDTPGASYVSQIFYDYPGFSSYLGDDINLSGFDSVVVRAVELVGGYFAGHTNHPIDSLYLGFTTDSTNLPAWSQAVWQSNLPTPSFDDVNGGTNNTYIMYLDPPAVLHNGKSWMVAAPYMGYATKDGEWGWAVNDPAVIYGSAPAWRNPVGSFGYGTNWQRASVLGMAGDGIFRVLGNKYSPAPYWVSHTAMNVGGYGQAVAGWKGRVYAFGGAGGGSNAVNTIRYYDTLAGTWTTTSTVLPQALYFASAATVGDKIYIIGGSNVWPTPLSTVYCYSPDGDSISTRASLPVATMEHACGARNGTHIYVMGGGNWSMTPIANVQVYDIAADTWSAATAMPAARGALGGAVCGNYAVAVCGNSSGYTWEEECYVGDINLSDPTSITWTTGTPYPGGALCRPSTMAYDGKLFISCGYNGSFMATTYDYDPDTDVWTMLPDKTTATVSAGQAALVGRWAYVVGGEAGSQNESLFLGGGTGIVGGPTAPVSPAMLSLMPNYPNPVRGRTNISFNLPKAGAYELKVFNIAGQMVDRQGGLGQAGPNRLTWNAGRLSAGVYLYSVSSNGQSATRKLVVLR
jgi:N-acetylneuraminic acid mutarotase